MKRISSTSVLTFSLLAAAGGLFAQTAPPPPPLPVVTPVLAVPPTPAAPAVPPQMQFAEPVYDFGKAKSGDLIKHEFIFTNTGSALLTVSNVQPSCGCTTAGEWSRQVEPGKTGMIPVQFNSSGYNGNVLKTITVTSSDAVQRTTVLQLKGSVWKPIETNPQFVMFNGVQPGSETSMTNVVQIKNNMEESLDVWGPEVNSKSFTVQLETNQPGKEYKLI